MARVIEQVFQACDTDNNKLRTEWKKHHNQQKVKDTIG